MAGIGIAIFLVALIIVGLIATTAAAYSGGNIDGKRQGKPYKNGWLPPFSFAYDTGYRAAVHEPDRIQKNRREYEKRR